MSLSIHSSLGTYVDDQNDIVWAHQLRRDRQNQSYTTKVGAFPPEREHQDRESPLDCRDLVRQCYLLPVGQSEELFRCAAANGNLTDCSHYSVNRGDIFVTFLKFIIFAEN